MRRFAIISGCVALTLTTAIVALIALDNPESRVAAVQKCFTRMPNVKVTYISDLTKQASQSITGEVEVSGKGQMSFAGLGEKSFGNSSHIGLSGIGPYNFRTRQVVGGQERYGYAVDVGPASPIPAARSLGITNIQSAVAHYDELLALVVHWPATTGEWPVTPDEEIHFPDLPRGDYYFCLKR